MSCIARSDQDTYHEITGGEILATVPDNHQRILWLLTDTKGELGRQGMIEQCIVDLEISAMRKTYTGNEHSSLEN